MERTERLGLALPGVSDYVNIETLNENFKRLDALTKDDIGLGNVPNVSTNDQQPTYTVATDLTELNSGEKLSAMLAKIAKAVSELISHLTNKGNPHKTTAADVGAAPTAHNHSASNITSGTLPVARGGTGNTSVDTTPTSGSTKMVTSGGVYTALSGKAAASHGNHVPATQAASNKKFLRNDNTWQDVTPTNIGAAVTETYTTTVTTSWTASGDYYYQDITVSGILATDSPIVDIVCGSDNAANKVYSENICKVFRITTSANKIRVWATEAISTAFPIQLKVVR